MDDHHHLAVRELNLRDCSPSYMADRVVPGLRTSAAFFTFLRANLVLTPSAISSIANTPNFEPWTSQTLPSPSPLSASVSLVPFDDIPPLSLEPLQSSDDKTDGMRLISESVAQMGPRSSNALLQNPVCLIMLGAALAAVYRFVYLRTEELAKALTICSGVALCFLLGVRYMSGGYSALAKKMDLSWLESEDGEDMVLGARYGSNIVGTLVLRLEPKPQTSSKKRSRNTCLKGGKGVIRAWTTHAQRRGNGIGKDLLLEAVKMTKECCGRDAEVGFAKEHANSVMLLPSLFNRLFRHDEMRATKTLQMVLEDWELSKKMKRRNTG